MHTLNIPQLKKNLGHIALRHADPCFIWGPPGVGKSEAIEQLAKEHDAVLVDVRLSQYDSVDLRGFPDVDRGTNQTVWHPPATLPFTSNSSFPNDRLIILFFDEANAASAAVSAVAYQIVNDRRCGEHRLKPNVRIIMAGNREGDRGVTNKQPLPLSNRLIHYEVDVNVDAWCEHAQEVGVPPVAIAFFQFRKELLNTFDPSKPEKSFCTPRTAKKAWRYYADDEMPNDVKQAAMAGAVGDGVAMEMWGFVKVWQEVAQLMPRILKEPKTVKIPEKIDMQYAIAVSVSGSMTDKTVGAYYQFLCRMEPEFVVMAWQLAVKRDSTIYKTNEFIDFSKRYKVIFRND